MNTTSFYIVCLKYAPGMWQHMESFANQMLLHGYPVRLLIAPEFHWMNKSHHPIAHYSHSKIKNSQLFKLLSYLWLDWPYIKRLLRRYQPAAILFASWHPLNFLIALLVKSLYPGTPIIAWLHEPYKDNKSLYGSKGIIIYLIEFFQTLSLHYINVVILHSYRGLRLFEKRYYNFKGVRLVIPLEFQDDGPSLISDRRYISFIGRAEKAKGIEMFFSLVENSARNHWHWEYQIVTSSNIQNYLEALTLEAREKLHVVNEPRISDEDLRSAAANSLSILALYKETMQSGVIPVALMKGTPVIGTDIDGITEWIQNKKTGVIVSKDPTMQEINNALIYISAHFEEMSARCRTFYLSTFDDANWSNQYGWLAQLLPDIQTGTTAIL